MGAKRVAIYRKIELLNKQIKILNDKEERIQKKIGKLWVEWEEAD